MTNHQTPMNPIEINDSDSDTIKGAKTGAMFGHALAGSIDEVGQGAANIVSVAGHTVLGSVSKLVGTGLGGAVQGVKALFTRKQMTSEEMTLDHDLKMQRLELAEESKLLKAEFSAKRLLIKQNSKKATRRAKAEKVLAELEEG